MASRTADTPDTSDLGSSSSSTNEGASYTKISTAVLVTKMTSDPLRFIRGSGTPVAVTKTPPTSAAKSPSVSANRKRQDSQSRKEAPRWEDDGSSEWRDSFSSWVGKRKGVSTSSNPGAPDYSGSAMLSQNDLQGVTPDTSTTCIGDSEPPSSYQTTPTWKRATDETDEDERWDSGSECNPQSMKNSSLDKPAPPENVNNYQLVDSVDLHSSPARMHNAATRTEAIDVAQTALNTSTPTHIRSQNVQPSMARPQEADARTDDRPNDESEERCLSVRDALKKYSTQIGATPAPPPVRPKPTPSSNRSSFGKSDAVDNSSRQQPARTQSQMAARTDDNQETITQRSVPPTQLASAPTSTEREVVEMDELTGLRKVSQFLNSMQQDIAYGGSTPAPAYSNDYRPSASPRSDTAYHDKMQGNFDDEAATSEVSDSAPPSTEQDQEKVVGSVSADQACAGCAKHLEAGAAMYIEKLRSVFHIHCFRCSICRDSLVIRQRCVNREYGDEDDEDDPAADALTTVTVFIRDSKLLCGACFERLPKQHSPH